MKQYGVSIFCRTASWLHRRIAIYGWSCGDIVTRLGAFVYAPSNVLDESLVVALRLRSPLARGVL